MIRPIYTVAAVAALILILLLSLVASWDEPGQPLNASTLKNSEMLELTGTTARLSGDDYLHTATAFSQAIYASAQDKDRPGAVVLVRDDDPLVAVATTRLQHHPINAPMLFLTDGGRTLPKATKDELERLRPEGVVMDNNVKVYLAGDIGEDVAKQVEEMGLETRRIYAPDPVAFAEILDEYLATLDSNHMDVVFVASTDAIEYAYPAANWNAHMGDGFAFVTPQSVPNETRRMLERRWPDYPYIYIFAPPSVVNESTMAELSRYGHVQRIPGETPQEMAVKWAGYKDSGRRVDWWFSFRPRSVGWGISEPGHNLILANPSDWREVVPTGVLSHMGKHAFLLLTHDNGSLPEEARPYLMTLKPTRTHPSQQVFNFGWISGNNISTNTAQDISDLLAVME